MLCESNLLGDDGTRGCTVLVPIRPTKRWTDTHVISIFGWGGQALLHIYFRRASPSTPHGDTTHGAWRFFLLFLKGFFFSKDTGADINFGGGVSLILHMAE